MVLHTPASVTDARRIEMTTLTIRACIRASWRGLHAFTAEKFPHGTRVCTFVETVYKQSTVQSAMPYSDFNYQYLNLQGTTQVWACCISCNSPGY